MVDLVLIYNHKYESNIAKLDRYYEGRFHKIWHLMPFYRGALPHVIAVYGGSFVFQGFIAQAVHQLKASDASRFLFVSDDLLLDPHISQDNLEEHFGLTPEAAFLAELHDLSEGIYHRGVTEARKTSLDKPGLEIGHELPSFGEALKRVQRHLPLMSLTLRKYPLFWRPFRKHWWMNRAENWSILKGIIWHLREKWRNWRQPKDLPYPFIGGYSDLFSLPASSLEEFAHYCGIFAAADVFVEIALPTALALVSSSIQTEAGSPRKGFNVWFPPEGWAAMERKSKQLEQIEVERARSLARLKSDWPKEFLYLHPIKLSKWS